MMMQCPQCGDQQFSPTRGCPACAGQPGWDGADFGPVLARANLLRMRGRWAEAAEHCAEVLRHSPQNVTAHSLLGDVYLDQGRLEDARKWYSRALQLNPHSRADRSKLTRVSEMLEARQPRSEWEAVANGCAEPVPPSLAVREAMQRVAAIAGAAVCGLVLVMATLMMLQEHPTSLAADSDALPRRPALRSGSVSVETTQERALLEKMEAIGPVGPARAVRVDVDPRTKVASLRVYLPRKVREAHDLSEQRLLLMREGYRLARAVHGADPNLSAVRVTIVSPSGITPTSETRLLLVGDLLTESLGIDPQVITPEELQRFYHERTPPMWAAELALP